MLPENFVKTITLFHRCWPFHSRCSGLVGEKKSCFKIKLLHPPVEPVLISNHPQQDVTWARRVRANGLFSVTRSTKVPTWYSSNVSGALAVIWHLAGAFVSSKQASPFHGERQVCPPRRADPCFLSNKSHFNFIPGCSSMMCNEVSRCSLMLSEHFLPHAPFCPGWNITDPETQCQQESSGNAGDTLPPYRAMSSTLSWSDLQTALPLFAILLRHRGPLHKDD